MLSKPPLSKPHSHTSEFMCTSKNLLTLATSKDGGGVKAANRRKARISSSIFYLNLFLSTTCVLHRQPVASLLRCTVPSTRPPSALHPRRWMRKHVCAVYVCPACVCACHWRTCGCIQQHRREWPGACCFLWGCEIIPMAECAVVSP